MDLGIEASIGLHVFCTHMHMVMHIDLLTVYAQKQCHPAAVSTSAQILVFKSCLPLKQQTI